MSRVTYIRRLLQLRDERQVFHQVVADSLTKYVSELQDTLKQSTQALVQSQEHLDAVVQELQCLQYEQDNNHSSSNSNTPSNNTISNTKDSNSNNINLSSHSNSNTQSNDAISNTNDDDK
jgi:hypothetical protein